MNTGISDQMTVNELIKTEIVPVEIFGNSEQLEQILSQIENQVLSEVPDLLSKEGRKRIRSLAYQISRSKTYLDNAGKDLISDVTKKIRQVNSRRKLARDFLDELRDKVKAPLEKYELRAQVAQAHEEAIVMHEQWKFEQKKKKEIERQEADIRSREAEIRKQQKEAERQDREEKIRKRAAEEEKKRQKAKRQYEEDRKQQRIADKQHRFRCYDAALQSFLDNEIGEETARHIIRLIAAEKIEHIRIEY